MRRKTRPNKPAGWPERVGGWVRRGYRYHPYVVKKRVEGISQLLIFYTYCMSRRNFRSGIHLRGRGILQKSPVVADWCKYWLRWGAYEEKPH